MLVELAIEQLKEKYGTIGMRYRVVDDFVVVSLLPEDYHSAKSGRVVWQKKIPVVQGCVDPALLDF